MTTGSSLHINPPNTFQTFFFNPICHLPISKHNHGCLFLANPSFPHLTTALHRNSEKSINKSKMNFSVNSSDRPGDPIPSKPFLDSWKAWFLGLLATFSNLKKEIDTVEEKAEQIVEKVEKVAGEVEKLAEDVADDLPQGGKLRNAATAVENLAKKAVKDANEAEEFIDKVEAVEKDVESAIEPVTGKSNVKAEVENDQK